MKDKILIAYSVPKQGLEELSTHFDLVYPGKEFFTTNELIELIPGCVALLSIFNREIPKEVIQAGNSLRIISNYGVGFNNIDLDASNGAGIVVCNTPEAVCEPTAELCFALILSLCRGIVKCHSGLTGNPDFEWGVMKNLGTGLQGKTLGIIGMGKIGQSVANKAAAFGMQVIYHNRNIVANSPYTYQAFEELLSKADIVSLHCPLTEATRHLVGENEFKLMKNTALLVNTSRGPVVDEKALANALINKEIAGAALDVFENEPEIHPSLRGMDNVVLVPHIGTATIETRIAMGKEAGNNIISYLINGKEVNRVN